MIDWCKEDGRRVPCTKYLIRETRLKHVRKRQESSIGHGPPVIHSEPLFGHGKVVSGATSVRPKRGATQECATLRGDMGAQAQREQSQSLHVKVAKVVWPKSHG